MIKTTSIWLASLLCLWTLSFPARAEPHRVHLTSLDWPPYSGSSLQDGGSISVLVAQAFQARGIRATIEYYPWSRTIVQVRDAHTHHMGFFPAYYSAEREADYYMSDPIGESPIGLIERKDAPIVWNSVNDLGGKRIGVVQDYVNTAEFDALVNSGGLTVEAVVSDTLNIRKMIGRRIDTAVIDEHVFAYLLKTDPDLAAGRDLLQFNAKPLESKTLYLYFRRTPEGLALRDEFNAGLRHVRQQREQGGATAPSVEPVPSAGPSSPGETSPSATPGAAPP